MTRPIGSPNTTQLHRSCLKIIPNTTKPETTNPRHSHFWCSLCLFLPPRQMANVYICDTTHPISVWLRASATIDSFGDSQMPQQQQQQQPCRRRRIHDETGGPTHPFCLLRVDCSLHLQEQTTTAIMRVLLVINGACYRSDHRRADIARECIVSVNEAVQHSLYSIFVGRVRQDAAQLSNQSTVVVEIDVRSNRFVARNVQHMNFNLSASVNANHWIVDGLSGDCSNLQMLVPEGRLSSFKFAIWVSIGTSCSLKI